jgi:2-dehydro-3-deoxyphosphooctonate aldolase (KDO 8-P synthase)
MAQPAGAVPAEAEASGPQAVELAPGVVAGGPPSPGRLPVIAGPCVLESEELALAAAALLAAMAGRLSLPLVFKSSFDKANRSSLGSFRGPGLAEGLRMLARVKRATGLAVLTDVHEPAQCAPAAEVCDVLQIPAFLCRQTDLVLAAAATGRPVNIKKGQFMAPDDMRRVVDKARSTGNARVTVTERGVSFGYHNLVVDMRSFAMMHEDGIPVIYDVTHSLQLPGAGRGAGGESGGLSR